MLKIMLSLLFLLSLSNANITQTPLHKNIHQDIKNYAWMQRNKDIQISLSISKEAKRFFSSKELQRYIKLKLKIYARHLNIKQYHQTKDHTLMKVVLDLDKYNNSAIYYGLIELTYQASPFAKKNNLMHYRETIPLVGLDSRIVSLTKKSIDKIIENFADHYYYIKYKSKKKTK